MANTRALHEMVIAIPGVRALFARSFFHEFVIELPKPATTIVEVLAKENIVAGVALGEDFPELGDALLMCATETKTRADLDRFVDALRRATA
jgi:glycine dehydrogenase subunit 1